MSLLSRPAVAGVPLLVAAGLLWGTGGLLGALLGGATGLAPLAVAGYRLLVGGLLLWAALVVAALVRGGRPPLPSGRAAWRRTAAVALLAAQFQASYFAAVALTSVGLATLVTIGAAPVLVLLVERLRGRPATRRTTAACALAVLGLALLVGVPTGPDAAALVGGTALALLAAAGFAALTLLGTRPVDGLDTATSTAVAFTAGGALLLAVAPGVGFAPTPAALGLLAAFGVLPTALAYWLYFRGLRTAPASVGAVLALLEPLTGAVLAALVLGERLGVVGIVGAVLLGAAVLLAGRSG